MSQGHPVPIEELADEPVGNPEINKLFFGIGGCTMAYQTKDKEGLQAAVFALMCCSHGHNYVVNSDRHEVYCSKLAVSCIQRLYGDTTQ